MSGLEILGVVASAMQLADFGFKITNTLLEIFDRVQNYPDKIRSHLCQVKQLIEIARLISENSCLHTRTVNTHLKSISAVVLELKTTLEHLAANYRRKSVRRRYLQIVARGAFEEKQIGTAFVRLEHEKTALLISINIAHADILGNIKGGVDLLVGVVNWDMGCGVILHP